MKRTKRLPKWANDRARNHVTGEVRPCHASYLFGALYDERGDELGDEWELVVDVRQYLITLAIVSLLILAGFIVAHFFIQK